MSPRNACDAGAQNSAPCDRLSPKNRDMGDSLFLIVLIEPMFNIMLRIFKDVSYHLTLYRLLRSKSIFDSSLVGTKAKR